MEQKNSKIFEMVFVAIFIVFLVGYGLYHTVKPAPSSVQNETEDPTKAWKKYTNPTFGFSLKYPLYLDESSKQISATGDFDGVNPDMFRAFFPKDFQPGTNLYQATVVAGVKEVSQSQCWQIYDSDPDVYGSDKSRYENVSINGLPFRKATVSEGAAGNFYVTYRYALFTNNTCYLLSLVAHSGNLGVLRESDPTIQQYDQAALSKTFDQIVATFKIPEAPIADETESEPAPIISSIIPISGKVGTSVEIKGENLNGFEGDTYLYFVKGNGESGSITASSYLPEGATSLTFTVPQKMCTKNMGESDLPCPSYMVVTPGKYKVYAYPWGRESNEVEFVVTK